VAKHGMTLDEAAQRAEDDNLAEPPAEEKASWRAEQQAARYFREAELRRAADKARWEQAWKEAKARGLDEESEPSSAKKEATFSRPRSQRRRNPVVFAQVLLKETCLPINEIAAITDLDIYQVAGLKLKLRNAEAA